MRREHLEALANFDCQLDSQRETADRECLSGISDRHRPVPYKVNTPKTSLDLADLDRWMKELLYTFPRYTILLKAR